MDAKFSFFNVAGSDDRSVALIAVIELLAALSDDNCIRPLSPGGIFVILFPSRIKVSIAAQAILSTSVATAESVRFFPVQSMVTVVLVPPVVNAHVHVFKSATGGQRQTKGLEKEEKGFPF